MSKQMIVEAVEALKSLSPPGSPKSPTKSPTRLNNLRKSLQKRSSKLALFVKDRANKGESITSQQPAFTDEMIRLETVIQSQKGKQLLIQQLLGLPGNYSVKVRFICSVDTYDAAEAKEEKQKLAQKLVETFVDKTSMFKIALSDERYDALMAGNYDHLFAARRDVLEDLANNEEVMKIVGEVEVVDGV